MKQLKQLCSTPQHRAAIREQIDNMSHPGWPYFLMLVFSTIIAAYGLLANSTAVVIGAMLVAPLMGPIFGVAMSLIGSSRKLLWDSAVAEAAGVVGVIVLSFLVAKVSPLVELPPEVLSRTSPTLFDILIALASGLAGAFALVDEKRNAALPGVAISTALVPPLASAGICFAAGEWMRGGGACVLFFVNFLAIELAAAGVFTFFGLGAAQSKPGFASFLRQFGWSLGLLLLMAVFLTKTLIGITAESELKRTISSSLTQSATSMLGAELDDLAVRRDEGGGLQVEAEFLTRREFEPATVESMQAALAEDTGEEVNLIVRSLITIDNSAEGPFYLTQDELAATAEARAAEQRQRQRAKLQQDIETAIREKLGSHPGAVLDELRMPEDTETSLVATVSAPVPVGSNLVQDIEETLRDRTGTPYNLTVRTIQTTGADRTSRLYQPEETPLTETELAIQSRLRRAIANQLSEDQEGVEVIGITTEEKGGRKKVRAVVQSPVVVGPEKVAEVQAALREFVAPAIDLTIRTEVRAEAAAGGYILGDD